MLDHVDADFSKAYSTFTRLDQNKWSRGGSALRKERVSQFIEDFPEDGCNCKGSCGPGCINRYTSYECTDKICKNKNCGNRCSQAPDFNSQDRIFSFCKLVDYGFPKGYGLIATREILPGEVLMEYMGELVTTDTFQERLKQQGMSAVYGMAWADGLIVDAKPYGNEARFINHSCDPNLHAEAWFVGPKEKKNLIVCSRKLKVGEELSFSYQMEFPKHEVLPKCYCGAANCTGKMGRGGKIEEEINIEAGSAMVSASSGISSSTPSKKQRLTSTPKTSRTSATAGPRTPSTRAPSVASLLCDEDCASPAATPMAHRMTPSTVSARTRLGLKASPPPSLASTPPPSTSRTRNLKALVSDDEGDATIPNLDASLLKSHAQQAVTIMLDTDEEETEADACTGTGWSKGIKKRPTATGKKRRGFVLEGVLGC